MARDEYGTTPLHFADTPANIQALIAVGADVMAQTKNGITPLYIVAQSVKPANIQTLLAAGADVMARTEDGWTPLHIAALYGTPAMLQVLLNSGSDAKATDKDGETPWDLAQENEKLKGTKAYWALNDAQYD